MTAEFFYRDPDAPRPNRPIGVGALAHPDGRVVRLLSFVFRVRAEDFGPLRVSEESEELRFFRRGELPGLDMIETSGPILDAY